MTKFEQFLQTHHGSSSPPDTGKKRPSLTLEGQIVAIADEVAQRVADISDGLESRYFEVVKNILGIELKRNNREELERCIRETLIRDIVGTTRRNLKKIRPAFGKIDGIGHDIYNTEVVSFSGDMQKRNGRLEEFITKMMAQSEDVRESDSRSAHIIRQLFKAYLRDVSLLPDRFIAEYFQATVNRSTFSAAHSMLLHRKAEAEKSNAPAEHIKALEAKLEVFEQIKSGKWRYTRELPGSGRVVIDMKWVGAFFAILTEDERAGQTPELGVLFDEYILRIGFHIAGMTNTEAFTAYNRVYGH